MRTRIYRRVTLAALAAGLGLSLAASTAVAAPSLGVTATDAAIGQTVHATVLLSESPSASGELAFEVFGPGDTTCTGPALMPAPAPVTGEGEYFSGNFTPTEAGIYRWSVHYSGDSENPPADSICSATSTVSKAAPSLTGAASSAGVGSAIHDEVTIAGGFSPSGEVMFKVYGPADTDCQTPLRTEAAPIEGGQASSADFVPQQAGQFRWTASYGGDANNEAVALPCGAPNQSSVVGKVTPTLSGIASSAAAGSPISDSVTLAAGFEAGGNLLFRAYGPGDPTCTAGAAYEATVPVSGDGVYSPLGFVPGAGLYRWTVSYGGDGNNEAVALSCGSANQSSTVSKAAPSLTGAASSAGVGSAIHDEVTVTGGFSPSGEVTFKIYGPGDTGCQTPLRTEAAPIEGGQASSADFVPQQAGQFRWTASYGGDANNEAVALACNAADQSSTVGKVTPTLTGIASSAAVGSPISDSVTLAGGFEAGGSLLFRAYEPGDQTCTASPSYDATIPVSGGGVYSPPGFAPGAGLYRWTVSYGGDPNNEAVALSCGSANQSSTVAKASPSLAGVASSAAVGSPISDSVTFAAGFEAGGNLLFRAYGPGDPTCTAGAAYEATVPVSGDGVYSPLGFVPGAGLYRWTVSYGGDPNNEAAGLGCNAANQSSAVGVLDVELNASATSATVGEPVSATASIQQGAIPGGKLTFTAFSPGDANCSGAPVSSAAVGVSGNGSYRSPAFVTTRVGTYRWAVSYSGDPNHAATTAGCGKARSNVAQARPSITSAVAPQLTVGDSFQIAATLRGAYAPTGTVTFRIYGPTASNCAEPLSINTVSVSAGGTAHSDPFLARRPGHYIVVASYSGNATNQGATAPCDPIGSAADVSKRTPKVKPKARLKGSNRISIRARLSDAVSPSGAINFRLYRPGDRRCKGKPAFSGGVTIKSNGTYLLAQYLATKPGTYRLSVGYSGDQRNRRFKGSCRGAQSIQIG